MKKTAFFPRVTAALLALCLLLSLCPAAYAEERQLTVGTAEELSVLAKRCTSDDYSRGLTVILTADINAAGQDISIPIFLGTFDGQGYRIYGLRLTRNASTLGLFSRVEQGAVVKNLVVEGEVAPSGTQSRVGGIAGENYGSIESCRFSGVVLGEDSVGGIAGRNGESGTISGCTAFGTVRGTQYTGGIAGENMGTLLRCTNAAAVNTVFSDEDFGAAEMEELESTIYSLLKNEKTAESAVTTDTGGIAGYSSGVLQSCVNTGSVGYPHVGYNVGGVVGRQNGYTASCVNRGGVQGRKDVGGIVGQMTPDITLQPSEDLDTLRRELDTLQELIDRTLDDAQDASDTVSNRLERISGQADDARESADSLNTQLQSFVDGNVASVNELSLLIERYIDKAAPILEDLADASAEMETALEELRVLLRRADGMTGANETLLRKLKSFCTEMEAACKSMTAGMNALEQAFARMANGPVLPDTAQLREDTAALTAALAALNETVDQALEEYGATGSVSAETQEQLQADLRTVFDCYSDVVDDLNDLLQSTDFDGLRDQNLAKLRRIVGYLETAARSLASATDHMGNAMGYLGSALNTAQELNRSVSGLLQQADRVLLAAERAASYTTRALERAEQWARELSEEEPITFSQLGDSYTESADALNTALNGMGNELDALNGELSSANTRLLADVRAVNQQMMRVMDQFIDLLEKAGNTQTDDIYEDISEESLRSAVRGKVLECANYSTVTADRNAGGIAGSMAVEFDLDPEDDLLPEDRSSRYTYQTMAILLDCRSYGRVESRRSCAGGIVGRMDLGVVYGCGGWGNVSSDSGDYVGGVAGLSLSAIRSSYAKCTLSGGRYVGGIAGSGCRVSDCTAMVELADCTQSGGAIAGEITEDYSGNHFVSDSLAGVDRVSLVGKAEAVSYDALMADGSLPEELRHMTLRFVADGQTLRSLRFAYGDSFPQSTYPQAPEKEDCYLRWDREELNDLRFDTVVTAVYEPYITALASENARGDRPVLLAEGRFQEGDRLSAEPISPVISGYDTLVEAWSVELPEDGQSTHMLRWLLPEADGGYTVLVRDGENWAPSESEVIGSYLRFELPEDGTFAVVPAARPAWQLWATAALAMAAGVILALCLNKRKKAR